MPPRKRAASAPKPDTEAEQEAPEAPVDDTQEEQPVAVEAGVVAPKDVTEPEPPDAKPAKSTPQSVEQPCPVCFPAGWPDGATSAGCGHGTWNRDL